MSDGAGGPTATDCSNKVYSKAVCREFGYPWGTSAPVTGAAANCATGTAAYRIRNNCSIEFTDQDGSVWYSDGSRS